MLCLFCCAQEKNYEPEPDKDFICGRCIQILLQANQEDLNTAYEKAIEKGYLGKARAIESFLIPREEKNDRKTKKYRQRVVRKKTMRMVRPSRNKIRA